MTTSRRGTRKPPPGRRRPARRSRRPPRRAPRRGPWRWLVPAARWTATAAVWALVLASVVAGWYAYDLPDVGRALAATRRPSVTLVAADGEVLATIGDLYGKPVRLDELPAALPQAVLATEDRRFYSHFGIDPIALARAVYVNLRAGGIRQGASTITQQVAKNLFLTPQRTIKRKIQEVMLALWLEHRFTKDEILAVYLNRVYLGAGTYGFEAAAQKYFSRPASALTTYQAAMLAGMLKAPSRYNPIANPPLAARRAEQVLDNMVAAGYLTPAQAEAARRRPDGGAAAARWRSSGRHFADWVLERVAGFVSPGDRDITVVTTLDSRLQRLAEAAIAGALDGPGAGRRVGEAALVAMTPEGAVKAMVGGRDHARSQFNRATQALRQPGSAFKPVVYLAGLEAGLGPDSRLIDGPLTIDGWSPRNFARRHRGVVTVRQALAYSINTVAVKVAERAGRTRVLAAARRLGLTSELKPTPSLALGSGEVTLDELTAAYAVFANGGYGVWAHGIERILDADGRVLYARSGSGPGRVVAAAHVAAMNDMLSNAVAEGTGRAARLDRPVAGKTGTSQDFRDAWFVGYSAHLVTGVWMGNDDGSPMDGVTGGSLPATAWREFMTAAHRGVPPQPLPGLEPEPVPAPQQSFWRNLFAGLAGGNYTKEH